MAGKKISDLPILPSADLDSVSDSIVMVDSSAQQTKRMAIGDMIMGVVNPVIADKLDIIQQYIANNTADLTPPPTPTGFFAIGGVSSIDIQHDVPSYTQGHGHLETVVYGVRWETNQELPLFENSTEISRFSGHVHSYATGATAGWRLWIKWKSKDGVLSVEPAGGLNGLYVVTSDQIQGIIDALTGQLNESHLTQELNARIDLIDGNEDGSVNSKIAQEAIARNEAILLEGNARIIADEILNAAIISESNAREAIDTVLSDGVNASRTANSIISDALDVTNDNLIAAKNVLTTALDAVSKDTDSNKSAIVSEQNSRVSDTEALTSQIGIAVSVFGDSAAAIVTEANTRATSDSVTANSIQSVVGSSQSGLAAVSQEAKIRSDTTGVLASLTDQLVSSSNDNSAAITDQQKTFLNTYSSLAATTSTLTATTGENSAAIARQDETYSSLTETFSKATNSLAAQFDSNSSAITAEQKARTTENSSTASTITNIVAQTGSNASGIKTEQEARTSDTSAVASSVTNVVAKIGQAGSAISSLQTATTSADSTTASAVDSMKSAVGDNKTYITQEAYTRADETTALSNKIERTLAETVAAKAGIETEAIVRADAVSSAALQIAVLKSSAENSASSILQESAIRSSADLTSASLVNGLVSTVGTNVAAIKEETVTRTTADTAYAGQITSLGGSIDTSNSLIKSVSETTTTNYNSITTQTQNNISKLGDNLAAIDAEKTTRVQTDLALSNSISSLVSSFGGNAAAINTEAITRASADGGFSNLRTTISASNDVLASAIQAESTARTNADSTTAKSILQVQSRLDTGDYAAVKEQASTTAGELTGLKAQYTVKVDVNGYVSGFGLASTSNNSTPTSEFTIVADKFAIAPVASNAWAESTAYTTSSHVYYEGNTYDCITAHTSTQSITPLNATYWKRSASPFYYINAEQTINGITIPPGLYVAKANIAKLTADQIDTRGLTIKDSNGKIILASGAGIDWASFGSTGSSNLVKKSIFTDGTLGRWYNDSSTPVVSASGGMSSGFGEIRCTERNTYEAGPFPVTVGEKIYISADVKSTGNTYGGTVGLAFVKADGTIFNWLGVAYPANTAYANYSGSITVPENAVTAIPWLQIASSNGTTVPYVAFSNIYIGRSQPGATLGATWDDVSGRPSDADLLNAGPNIAPNPDLEGDLTTNTTAPGWTRTIGGAPLYALRYITSDSLAPPWNKKQPIFYTNCNSTDDYAYWRSSKINITDDVDYCLSCWAKAYSGTPKVYLRLRCYDIDGVHIGSPAVYSAYTGLTTDWQLHYKVLGPSGVAIPTGTRSAEIEWYGGYLQVGASMATRFGLNEGKVPNRALIPPGLIGQHNPITSTNASTYIENAAIKSAMIESLSADKISAGTIDVGLTIKSTDGKFVVDFANKLISITV